jgi:hypothetical protein
MLTRSVNIATPPINLPVTGLLTYTVTGLGLTLANFSSPPQILLTLMGDGTQIITADVSSALTSDGFTVTFSAPIPNTNWFLGWFIS